MMHSAYNKWLSGFLLVTIMLIIVPGNMLHGLVDHEDTIDVLSPDAQTTFDVEHHHCEILKYQIPQFLSPFLVNIPLVNIPGMAMRSLYVNPNLQFTFHNIELRGPPCSRIYS